MPCRPGVTAAIFIVLAGTALVLGAAPLADPLELGDVLRRAGEMVVRYARESAVIVADETCRQTLYRATVAGSGWMGIANTGETLPVRRRNWKAELTLLQLPDRNQAAVPWLEVRDVLEVDGEPLPDRTARLERLLHSDPKWQLTKAREIVEESARHNLGSVRTINTPAIPLLMLHPPNQPRFAFGKVGEATVDGVTAWRIGFQELRRPSLIGAADTGWDMPSGGTFWIAPDTGEVLRADLRCGTTSETRLTVTYRRHERFGLPLPVEMTEKASAEEAEWVDGKCRYSNFRRFETGGRLLPPKAPGDESQEW